jgi:hypothetical protein
MGKKGSFRSATNYFCLNLKHTEMNNILTAFKHYQQEALK